MTEETALLNRTRTIRWALTGVTALAVAGGVLAGTAAADFAPSKGKDKDRVKATPGYVKVKVKVMTWNVCANSTPRKDDKGQALCAMGKQTDRVASGIRRHMRKHKGLKAVMLQEICKADINKLRTLDGMGDWSFGFSGIQNRGAGESKGKMRKQKCSDGRGSFGVAVGVKSKRAEFDRYHSQHVPNGRDKWKHWNVKQAGVCTDAFATRFCGTHFTPWKGGHRDWSAKKASEFLTAQYRQAEELAAKGSGIDRVVLGGDLNAAPTQGSKVTPPAMDPLYNSYKECSQDAAGGARGGEGTIQQQNGTRGSKIDYIFSNGSKASCRVPDRHITAADHVPVTATITF
jgi:endonuclease/exonuclease/phosphatase family metal-dependent hydrolase